MSRTPAVNEDRGVGLITEVNSDDADASGTVTTASAKTYSLAANTYAAIIAEAEINNDFPGITDVLFELKNGVTLVDSFRLAGWGDPTTRAAQCGRLKARFVQTAAATISVNVTVSTGAGTWTIRSLNIYGVD